MIYAFGDFTLDTRRCELRRSGTTVRLEPQVYAILAHLLDNPERMLSREHLLDHVWGHRFVTPATLNTRIKALRRALGDDGTAQAIIETVRGRGFRFIAPVTAALHPDRSAPFDLFDERVGSGVPPEPSSAPSSLHQEIRFVRARDDVRIAYASSGQGPPLVKAANWLSHLEFDLESPVWRHWLEALSRDHTLIRYDARGCGLSDWDPADLSFEAWVEDLGVVVDALGVQRFPLFAISQGCAVAVRYAVKYPQRVTRLILYGGYAQGRYARARDAAELEEARMIIELMPRGWGRDNPAFRDFFASMFLPEGSPEQMRWFSDLQRVTTTPEVGVRLRTVAAGIDILDLAPQVAVPTLVLHATRDAAVPFEQGRLLAGSIPDARFVAMDSPNHILLESEPAWHRFLAEVRSFLAEEDQSPAPGWAATASEGGAAR
jgi:pimeloyl-ACP methyl ester carboxylesterase/DNA-binding winged helix-turn-helix (wHTH) protein